MLYLAIPAHNEAATIGVLLWRLRTVLAEFPREYEAVVYDDASSDSTSEILESYARVMPLTVLRGERRVGYAGAVDALVRHVARDTRYPRRDAMLLLQGDFTDSPSLVPEFVKRFEGGTDLVAGERSRSVRRKAPTPVKRLLQVEPWLMRFLVRAEGVRDLTSSYRLIRISVLRDLLRTVGDEPVCAGDARTANADFLMRLIPLARRVEALPVEPTWEIRLRETRVVAVSDAMNVLRWAWRSRGRRAVPSTAPETSDAPRQLRPAREGRGDLRLESRSDVLADATTTEHSRGRKPRNSRADQRLDGRSSEARTTENRSETRGGDSRNDTRPQRPARGQSRRDSKVEPVVEAPLDRLSQPRLEVKSADATPGADSDAGLAQRERPPRRKRTRGRRERSEAAGATESPETLGTDAQSGESREPIVPAHRQSAGTASPGPSSASAAGSSAGDASDVEFEAERELSPALSEAVADAELELDANARTRPPRKKRRRRGSRGGRGAANASGQDDGADDGPADSTDSGEGTGSGDDSANDREGGASYSSAESADDAGEGRDAASEGDGDRDRESRSRRRGRRGRRGGARRSRGARGDGENASGGEDFSAPPPPPAPEL